MKRLNILPEGVIYLKAERPVRDMLRRRLLFVRHRTSHILSVQSAITRNLGEKMSADSIWIKVMYSCISSRAILIGLFTVFFYTEFPQTEIR